MAKDARLRRAVERLKSTAEMAAWPSPLPAGADDARRLPAAQLAEIDSRLRRQEQILEEIAAGRQEPSSGTLTPDDVHRIAAVVASTWPAPRRGFGLVGVVLLVLFAAVGGIALGAWQSELVRECLATTTAFAMGLLPSW